MSKIRIFGTIQTLLDILTQLAQKNLVVVKIGFSFSILRVCKTILWRKTIVSHIQENYLETQNINSFCDWKYIINNSQIFKLFIKCLNVVLFKGISKQNSKVKLNFIAKQLFISQEKLCSKIICICTKTSCSFNEHKMLINRRACKNFYFNFQWNYDLFQE